MTETPTVINASYSNSPILGFLDAQHRPAMLMSFFYLYGSGGFRKRPIEQSWMVWRHKTCYRHWVLDSGAFSAWSMGIPIDLDDYIAVAKDVWQADPTLHEIFALDVFNNWRQGKANVEKMWRAGLPAIPVFHVGEPEDLLIGYARDYPKIALGGMAPLRGSTKTAFAEQCFSRVWPCAIHGLAVSKPDLCMAVPWHSIDASSCEKGPRNFGMWRAFSGKASGGAAYVSARAYYDIRPEVAWYAALEAKMRWKWSKEMAELAPRLAAANWRGYDAATNREGPLDRVSAGASG